MERGEFKQLAEKILTGRASDDEVGQYVRWFNAAQQDFEIADADLKKDTIFKGIRARLYRPQQKVRWLLRAAAAASLFIGVAGASYYFINRSSDTATVDAIVKNDIHPGGSKATLTLSNGKKIILDDSADGQIATDQGVAIKKSKNGQLVYDLSEMKADQQGSYQANIISTPRGGEYQVVLPDGSRVWLNAASSLKFPSAFSGNAREVELTGEAYFEVTKDKIHPFRVKSTGQQIEVLGTHFEVNAYGDEKAVKTTLLEGSVKISSGNESETLKPGQQSVVAEDANSTHITVNYTNDADEIMAWKNGLFVCNNTSIPVLMRQISRWYDVEVIYEGKIPDDKFSGAISRSVSLSKVLKLLQYTGLNFKIEGRKLIIK